jgi:hypothetical protein
MKVRPKKFVLAREFAESNDRTREGDRPDGGPKEQLQTVTGRNRIAQIANDAQ